MVLEDDGAVLSSAIQAAGMAFVDASIPCYDILTSSTIAIRNKELLVDPTGKEEESENLESSSCNSHGTVTLSSLSSMDQIAQILFTGFVDPAQIKAAKKQILELNKSHSMHLKKVISLKISRDNRES